MKQSLAPASPKFPDSPPAPEADDADFEPESATLGQRFTTWLKHFALYLGAVMTACAFGLYFLWRLPIPQEAAQLLKSAGDPPRSRSLATIVAPPRPGRQAPCRQRLRRQLRRIRRPSSRRHRHQPPLIPPPTPALPKPPSPLRPWLKRQPKRRRRHCPKSTSCW